MNEKTILERLDRIIAILQNTDRIVAILQVLAKLPSLAYRISNGLAVGAGILSILTVVELIRSWLGG
jgi:predicted transcriptional regulator